MMRKSFLVSYFCSRIRVVGLRLMFKAKRLKELEERKEVVMVMRRSSVVEEVKVEKREKGIEE